MTIRRYYTDSYTHAFTARVVELLRLDGRPAAVLDETFFYPSSGGQPHDTGRLGAARVLEVSIREGDGAVLHLLDGPVGLGPVEASVDWPRRFDHMQQHTGQHVLSQAFLRGAEAPTIGFHLGAETVSIDLGIPELSEAQAADAETLANEVIARNESVRAWFPAEAELATLALRKTPDIAGPLRLVAIGEFDLSACGGTHVARTGEIGLLAILRTERLKRGVRVEFLCGTRARADYGRKHRVVRQVAALLTCAPGELPDSVARLQSALADARHDLALFKERDLDTEATRLLGAAPAQGSLRVIRGAWEGRSIDEVKGLAQRLTAHAGVIVLFGVAGTRSQLLFGRAEDVAIDLKPGFDRILAALGGGRGGGTRLLQGAAGPSDLAALEAALRRAEAEIAGSSA